MRNVFDAPGMAAGYARWRPPVHERVIALARTYLGEAVDRALDVGCGAGLSTRAVQPVAREVIGLEPAFSMLQWHESIAPGASFVTGAAEALPFAGASFDLISAAGALNFADLDVFFPEARRVLRPGGRLLVYDYSHGREFDDDPALAGWFVSFLERYPPVASGARKLNPSILGSLDSGFALGAHEEFALALELTPEFYREYMLTSTNVAAAISRGVPEDEIRDWCERTLRPVWRGERREVLFRGYYALLS